MTLKQPRCVGVVWKPTFPAGKNRFTRRASETATTSGIGGGLDPGDNAGNAGPETAQDDAATLETSSAVTYSRRGLLTDKQTIKKTHLPPTHGQPERRRRTAKSSSTAPTDSPSPRRSKPPGAGGAASKMPRSCIAAPPSSVMNVEAGFGAVFSETGGGGGGRLSSVRSIAAFRRRWRRPWPGARRRRLACVILHGIIRSLAGLEELVSFQTDASIPRAPRSTCAHPSWALANVPSASALLMARS